MAYEHVLDLGRRDVLAAADDGVVAATLHEHVAVGVGGAAVAGGEPALGVDARALPDVGAAHLRAAGEPWDLRKAHAYSSYDHFDFKIPIGTVGDNYDRYRVRHAEFYESVKIIEQALDGLPEGPHITPDRKVALPPRHELATSMEALIHHFKLVTEGFRVPPGEVYEAIESPRGELGCYILADGSAKPARVHMRDPSFVHMQAIHDMSVGGLIADMIAGVAMLDPILGGVDR